MTRSFKGKKPTLGKDVFLAENCAVIGDVSLADGANIWYGAVLRGDENSIVIGENSNVQDNATVHVAKDHPVVLGSGVTVGHNAIVHGCSIGDDTMIGMGACILNGAVVGKNCLIGAGALVKEGQIIPDGSLVVGIPAKIVRELDEAGKEKIRANACLYTALAKEYMEEC